MVASTGPAGPSRFRTTRWSLVLAAGGDSAASREALEELCATYWRPVYGFVRRGTRDVETARDLTQGFFADFLERGHVQHADRSRGRFRSYVLGAVKHFLANANERERALKRGGGTVPLSLDDEDTTWEPAELRTPDGAFEREWALAVLRRAVKRLQEEQEEAGRGALFERLKPILAGEAVEGGYRAVADGLDLTTVAVKVAAHRLKKRYRELLLEEIARTVELPQEIDDELRHLFEALGA